MKIAMDDFTFNLSFEEGYFAEALQFPRMLLVSVRWEIPQHVTIEGSMGKAIRARLIIYAFVLSGLINLFLVLSGFAGLEGDRYAWLVRVANAIATPSGVIAKSFFEPKQHTVHAFVLAAAESLLCSFVFYAFILWLLFELVNAWRAHRNRVN